MSDFKEMVFKLDPDKREEQGAIVEKHLQKLGYLSDEDWNEKKKGRTNFIFIKTNEYGGYCYHNHDCEAKTFEPIPEEIERAKRQQGYKETDQGDQEEDEFIQISFVENQDKYDYINPEHYKQGSKEVIDMMIDIWGRDVVATYCEMNAFKYRMRLGNKPNQPIERDLQKAQWYENKAKELRR